MGKVIWVDEDQGELRAIAWMVARAGAELVPALSIEEGFDRLDDNPSPDAIILDMIVRTKLPSSPDVAFSGIHFWNHMNDTLKARTIVVSIVPFRRVPPEFEIPEGRYFNKLELAEDVGAFEDVLGRLLGVSEPSIS